MKEIALSSIEIEIQPEVAEVILKKKLAREYFCWLISKKLDEMIGNSGGKIKKDKLVSKLMNITNRSRFSIARYLDNGENIFWRFSKKRDILYLSSFTNICLALDINYIYSDHIVYDLELINYNFQNCKGILLAAIAAKIGNPISTINLSGRCDVCERSVRNYLNTSQQLKIVQKVQNFEALSSYLSLQEALQGRLDTIKKDGINVGRIRIKKYNDKYWILRQIPNSVINITGRTSIKSYQKALRKKIGFQVLEKHKKTYIKKETEGEGLEYLNSFSERNNELYAVEQGNINIFIKRGK